MKLLDYIESKCNLKIDSFPIKVQEIKDDIEE
jgi:hypothetical protein